jgi:hypothetical protein
MRARRGLLDAAPSAWGDEHPAQAFPPARQHVLRIGLGVRLIGAGLIGQPPAIFAGFHPDHARSPDPRADLGRQAQLRPVGPVKEGDEPRDIR